jgi:hypothetical protein
MSNLNARDYMLEVSSDKRLETTRKHATRQGTRILLEEVCIAQQTRSTIRLRTEAAGKRECRGKLGVYRSGHGHRRLRGAQSCITSHKKGTS